VFFYVFLYYTFTIIVVRTTLFVTRYQKTLSSVVTSYLRVSPVMHLTEKRQKSRLYIAYNVAITCTLRLFSEK